MSYELGLSAVGAYIERYSTSTSTGTGMCGAVRCI